MKERERKRGVEGETGFRERLGEMKRRGEREKREWVEGDIGFKERLGEIKRRENERGWKER